MKENVDPSQHQKKYFYPTEAYKAYKSPCSPLPPCLRGSNFYEFTPISLEEKTFNQHHVKITL